MKATGGSDAAKRRAGEHAAETVEDGMTVGLGTGSTAAYAIRAIGRAVDAGKAIEGVPTSFQARELAREVGIPLRSLADTDSLDIAIDGADQVADLALLKGGGAAHTREKLVGTAADTVVIVVDASKITACLDRAVPLEIVPAARSVVTQQLGDLGGEPVLRTASEKDGPVVTDNGNLVIDCSFGRIDAPESLAQQLSALPGVVEHGLFVGFADAIHVGTEERVDVRT